MGESGKHAGVSLYWWFCAILCLITALEWAVLRFRDSWGITDTILVVSLSICSVIKFIMVVGWYMHLRYDPKMLKSIFIFSLLLVFGVGTGLVVLMH